MKKTLITLALLTVAGSAYSANQIRFFGEVTDQSCSILVNDNPTNPAVLLDPITAEAVSNANVGEILMPQDVNVRIFGCTTKPSQVGIRLVPNSLVTTGAGTANAAYFLKNYLVDNPTAAQGNPVTDNVYLRLADATNTALSFANGDARLYALYPQPAGAADPNINVELVFKVGYSKADTSAPKLGLIQSNVQYAITYK